jgi:hypothetical protein
MPRPATRKMVIDKRIISGNFEDTYLAIDIRRYWLHPTKGWRLVGFIREYPSALAWMKLQSKVVYS